MLYLCGVDKTKRSLKNVHIKVDWDTLQIFYEMPSKTLLAMAGLDRKVPNKPEDYKACGVLKSCI